MEPTTLRATPHELYLKVSEMVQHAKVPAANPDDLN